MNILEVLKSRLDEKNFGKLRELKNSELSEFVARFIELCDPEKVFVSSDSPADIAYLRGSAVRNGEENPLAIEGHTIHFDNYLDQGRDKKNTGILVTKGMDLGEFIEAKDREWALNDIRDILSGIMKGREMYVCFFTLGPSGSIFSIPAVQITDSSCVAHSETILYRPGYSEFLRQGGGARFFRFVHSQGELDENKTSRNLDRRRIYIDVQDDIVYSANTQYGGNTIGLKKLAMRLAIKLGSREGWLTEHMLIMGIHGPEGRKTYFMGAFPSLCGKTSTAMLEGETIMGDDIAYLKKVDGEVRAVNVEKGMFGIIQGVNSKDDPSQFKALHSPGEVIFSNVLVTADKTVYWIGKGGDAPPEGRNHSGKWYKGKRDESGREIPPSHPNARFTLALSSLDNVDPELDNPRGVPVGAIVYGGRDSDTSVPVEEAFDWVHGIITKGAALESETTAATLGREGVRVFNPMSNIDFLPIPIGGYIQINLDFRKGLKRTPHIFSVNYFIKGKNGDFLNEKTDKRVWYRWMELRVHGDVGAVIAPTGLIPVYEDLKGLFMEILDKDYPRRNYVEQFTVRIPENLAKIERITHIYRARVKDAPAVLFRVLEEQKKRLLKVQKERGDYVSPEDLPPVE